MLNRTNRLWCIIVIGLCATLWLSACGQAGVPLQITNVSVSPEPIVGQVVTLTVEIMSTNDEPDVTFTLTTLEEYGTKLHLVSGETEWAGSLTANQPQIFQFSVCAWEEGSWPIEISAVSRLHDAHNNGWDASEIIHLESSMDSGRLIRGSEYRMTTGPTPTSHPTTVSPECSGQSE